MEIFALFLLLVGVLGFFSEGFTLLTFWQFFRGKKSWLERWYERQAAEKSHEK